MIRAYWPWFLFFFVIAFAFAGTRPLAEPDEGRYAETAREMLVGGDWLVPHLQGEPHLTKPPFTYWAAAAGMSLLGVNEWGARLFLSFAFFVTIVAVVQLARAWGWRDHAALASGLVFSTALLPFVSGHNLTTDMFLTCWETLGVLCAWRVWRGREAQSAKCKVQSDREKVADGVDARSVGVWRWGFWLAFGMAFLTKGPPGWLPLLAVVVFALVSRNRRPRAGLWSWPCFGVFLLLSLSWYLVFIIDDPGRLRYFIQDEVIDRVATTRHGRTKPFLFYPPVILVMFAPWVFLWPAMFKRMWRTLRPSGRPGVGAGAEAGGEGKTGNGFRAWWGRLRMVEETRLFSLLWVLVPLAVFTLAKSRMYLYVLPLFVPASLWAGYVLADWFPGLRPRHGDRTESSRRHLLAWCAVVAVVAVWVVLSFSVLALPGFTQSRSRRELSSQLTRSLESAHLSPDQVSLYSIDDTPNHSITFYTGLRITELDLDRAEIIGFLQRERKQGRIGLVELKKKRLPRLKSTNYRILAEDGEWVVIGLAS